MPDLGKYAFEVLTAYGAALFLMMVLVALYWRRNVRIKSELAAAENASNA